MTLLDADTAEIVLAYSAGRSFYLDVVEVECGHLMDKRVAQQVRDAIRAGREDGMVISIRSAWRSMEEQEHLYDSWKQGLPGFHPADPPGYSHHQDGTAIDLAFATEDERERFAALAVAHGLDRPTPERWHFRATPQPPESSA